MTEAHARVVANHADELERRMLEAQVVLVIQPFSLDASPVKWTVTLIRQGKAAIFAGDVTVRAALWAACHAAGLTHGLNPP